MIDERFVFLGLGFSAITVSIYVIATLRGQVQPNKLSWFLLGTAPLVAFAAEVDEGVGLRSLMTLWVGLGPLLIFAVSFVNKKAYWKLQPFDLACGAIAVVALVLWRITGSGNLAIALSIAADGFALLPVFVKSWKFPHSEVPWAFAGGIVNSSIALLVLQRHTFADLAFPLYILLSCSMLVVIIIARTRIVARPLVGIS